MRPQASLLDIYRFFVPLIFMAEMMMVTHSIIHAFLARQPDPTQALAAFSIGFSFHTTLGSPIWSLPLVALSFLQDRRTLWQILRFGLRLFMPLAATALLVGLTPLGNLLYGGLLGASAEVAEEAKIVTVILLALMPIVMVRSLCTALIMLNRYTLLITLGTAVRVISLILALLVLPYVLQGAEIGAVAHLTCIVVETAGMMWLARRFFLTLPPGDAAPPSYREMWRFGWPLMMNHMAENGVPFAINFFLGRLPKADVALASFGVLNGLVRLLLSPLRNLAQTAQTLGRTEPERRMLLRFALQIVLIFATIIGVLFYTPLQGWVLYTVMGLNAELGTAVAPGLLFTLITVVFAGYAAIFRGLLSFLRITRPVAASATIRLLVVTGVGLLSLLLGATNGAVVGAVALVFAFGSDTLVLGMTYLRVRSTAKE